MLPIAPHALLAAALAAATLAPANAQAPTTGPARASRIAQGGVVEVPFAPTPVAAAAEEALATPVPAAALSSPQMVSQAVPQGRPAARRTPAERRTAQAPARNGGSALQPCASVTVDPPTRLTLGKSQVVRLPFPVSRVIIGGHSARPTRTASPDAQPDNPGIAPPAAGGARPGGAAQQADGVAEADVSLLSPTEMYFIGRHPGSMNVVLQGNDGRCLVKDLVVTVDPGTLQAQLAELMPDERGIKVHGADNSIVLTGTVNDVVRLDQVMRLASAYADSKKVVNLMRVTAPQQVMLEVRIAEVSKTLLDRFGIDFSRVVTSADGLRTSIISGILGGAPGLLGRLGPNTNGGGIVGAGAAGTSTETATTGAQLSRDFTTRGSTSLGLDMKKQDGVFRVLAEPTIMAISGQQASFLSGGKIFIPVAQSNSGGGTVITLEEKEFGVGLKFTPTVLDGRISLKVASEVSELSQTGTPFTTVGGVTSVLPSLTTRRVDTTVQLADGQSFAVAGLIRSNVAEALTKFPGLGETPVIGALFRSTEFQNDQTELMFVVTPRLVKPVSGPITLPTDNHVVPSRADVILRGSGEGAEPAPVPQQPQPQPQPMPVPAAPAQPATRQ